MKELFLDHSDFTKARRALISASISLIFLSQLHIDPGSSLSILGIKVSIGQKELVTVATVSVLYLSLAFAVRCWGHYPTTVLETRIKAIDSERNRVISTMADRLESKLRESTADLPVLSSYVPSYSELLEVFEYQLFPAPEGMRKLFNPKNAAILLDYVAPFAFVVVSLCFAYGVYAPGVGPEG